MTGTTIEQNLGQELVYLIVACLPFVILAALMLAGQFEDTFHKRRRQ